MLSRASIFILITIFLGVMLGGVFLMTGMDMNGSMTDCPFSSQTEVVCPMSVADHLGAWKAMFVSVVPAVLFLLASALLVPAIITAPHILAGKMRSLIMYRTQLPIRTYTYCYRALQEQFSNGILHPKLF